MIILLCPAGESAPERIFRQSDRREILENFEIRDRIVSIVLSSACVNNDCLFLFFLNSTYSLFIVIAKRLREFEPRRQRRPLRQRREARPSPSRRLCARAMLPALRCCLLLRLPRPLLQASPPPPPRRRQQL